MYDIEMEEKPVHCFYHDRLYKHNRWRDIAIKPDYIEPSEQYIKIKGYVYNTNYSTITGNKPLNSGAILTLTILEQELDNWSEIIDN